MKKENIIFILVSIFVMAITGISTSYAVSNYLYNSDEVSYSTASSGILSTNLQGALDELYQYAYNYASIKSMIYPVGSIYMSVTDSTVSAVESRFGGTWESFGAGKMLMGVNTSETEFNTVLKTGGTKTETLNISKMPKHRHTIIRQQWFGVDSVNSSVTSSIFSWKAGAGTGGSTSYSYKSDPSNLGADANDMLTTGGGGAHNNLPPYITVYMYKRTS